MLSIVKCPGHAAERFDLPESQRLQLSTMQTIVNGFIEIAIRGRDFVVWCDDEGLIKIPQAPLNFYRVADLRPIVGTVIVTALEPSIDGMICAPLTEAQADRICALLNRWAAADATVGIHAGDYDPKPTEQAEASLWAASRRAKTKAIPEAEFARRGLTPPKGPAS